MMSLGRNNLFLATWKGHSDPPLSQMDPKPFFFLAIFDTKIGGEAPNPTPAGGSQWGGGGGPIVPYTYI